MNREEMKPSRNVGAEQRLTHDDHQDEDHHGREGRDHLTIELEAFLGAFTLFAVAVVMLPPP